MVSIHCFLNNFVNNVLTDIEHRLNDRHGDLYVFVRMFIGGIFEYKAVKIQRTLACFRI